MTKDEIEVFVEEDGDVVFVHEDDVVDLLAGEASAIETTRASHVEPDGAGGWTADLRVVGGPVLGPYPRRDIALQAELLWLSARMQSSRLTTRSES